MKIVVIGASGTIGSAVAAQLARAHEVIRVARTSGDVQADIADQRSLEAMFERLGAIDAVVSAAGAAKFGPLDGLSDEDYELGLKNKLMGQVNVFRIGRKHLRDGGSVTLTSGVLAHEPMPGCAAISMANAALEAFAKAAALELDRGLRLNVVSPPWVRETLEAMGRDGAPGMPAAEVARAYEAAVTGTQNGETLDARAYRG